MELHNNLNIDNNNNNNNNNNNEDEDENIRNLKNLFHYNDQILNDLDGLLTYYKNSNFTQIEKSLTEQTERIKWQKNENFQLRKYLNDLKYTPMEGVYKAQMLEMFHQRLINLNSNTNFTENEIESNCYKIKNDLNNPLPFIDYALTRENDERNDCNMLRTEFQNINSLLATQNLPGNNGTIAANYLSTKLMETVDINNNLKSKLDHAELLIRNYEQHETYENSIPEFQRVSMSEIIDDVDEINDEHNRSIDTDSMSQSNDKNDSIDDVFLTKWELIPYDVSNLLHMHLDFSVDDIKDKFTKILLMHRISEKLFCKAVLNTTAKVIKRLFSLKASLNSMKAKDKIIILKIYMWINDPDGVRKLKEWTESIKNIEFVNENSNNSESDSDNDETITINYDLCNYIIPDDLTADDICNELRKVIEKHGISQKLFAKAVLNVAQSTISKFLSKPKQYYETSILAKNTYLKIYAWLKDPQGLDKLEKWTKKWKWNEHTQNEIDILEEINRTKRDNNVDYDTFDYSITKKISTEEIRDQLKYDLDRNKISQKLFAKAVLDKAESTLSLLLSNPKTWETLNYKSKEKYLQIYKWLIDPNRLTKLDLWEKKQNHKKEKKMKKLEKIDLNKNFSSRKTKISATTEINNVLKLSLTRQQELYLTKIFQINMYPNKHLYNSMAIKLNINVIKIINWFNHKRRKYNIKNMNNKNNNQHYYIVSIDSTV